MTPPIPRRLHAHAERAARACAFALAACSAPACDGRAIVDAAGPRSPEHVAPAPTRTSVIEDGAPLAIGAEAPPPAGLRWITGGPIEKLEHGKAHLVVFWAPWSGASTQVFARLSDLQRRNTERGLVVFAVTAADARGTTLERARTRLFELGELAAVPTAFDPDGVWRARWIGGEHDPALPLAFLVDREGRLAASGPPSEVELRLQAVLAGLHDLTRLAKDEAAKPGVLARSLALQSEFHSAWRASDWPRAVRLCDELLALDGARHRRFALTKFQVLFLHTPRVDEALDYARALADGLARDDVGLLNSLAWTLVDPHLSVPKRDLALAGRCAQRAVDLTVRRNAVLLDTLARVHAAQNELERALAIEEEAARLDPLFQGRVSELRAELGR
ncbi:MAG: hypothetical protein HZA53_14615 [Planctomycetes bacterium]|nr:hypothetical protein [Planctomycetota bacterium]